MDRSLRSARCSRPHRLMMIKVNFASFDCLSNGPDHDIMSKKKLMESIARGRRMGPEDLLDFAGSSECVATEVYLRAAKPVLVPATTRESMSE